MNIYSIALFFHIVGAIGYFIVLGLEWTGLRQIQNAMTSDQARAWMNVLGGTRSVGMASMLTAVITGTYMMVSAWGPAAWIIVALGSFALMMVLLMALTRPKLATIRQVLATERGPLSQTFHNLSNHPFLRISIKTRVAIALGIVFLMTVKPGLGGSLLTIGVAITLGLALSITMVHHERIQERPTD